MRFLDRIRRIGGSALPLLALQALLAGAAAAQSGNPPVSPPLSAHAAALREKFLDPERGVFVVAHRGCHNPSPAHKLPSAPENSLAAMDHCVQLGVDMMELDVRRTRDGALMILHDARVDRTTSGKGRLADMTLAQARQLRLRDNLGGNLYPTLTGETIPTLAEALQHARGRIMLNLDIKEDIYAEVIEATLAAGMADQVVVKRVVSALGAPLVDQAPYDKLPFMPIIGNWPDDPPGADLGAITARQLQSARRPAGVEIVFLSPPQFTQVKRAVKARKIRLWANTLSGVIGIIGTGSDIDALRNNGQAWGELIEQGIDTIQTDEPELLLAYLKARQDTRR